MDDCEDVELRTRVTMSELTIFCIYIGVLAVGNDSIKDFKRTCTYI